MGLWDMLKQQASAQFLDLLEWLEDGGKTVVWRFPVFNQAITDRSRLVVREGQAAVFVSEGRLSDVFGPGSYTLDTKNTPIMSFFTTIAYQFQYPYKGDVYFVSTRQFLDNAWGTPNPILMRDPEFGPVRVRGFGNYAFRITDPAAFLRQVVGTDGLFTSDEITGQLKKKLVSVLADTLGESGVPLLDLASRYMDLGDTLRDRINPHFQSSYGVTLTDFAIQNLTLPEEVEKALDTRSKMGVLGNLDQYAKLQAAEALGTAAANPGLGGAGVGMGVGFGLGQQMAGMMASAAAAPGVVAPPAVPPPLPSASYHYAGPSGQVQAAADEVARRVGQDRSARHLVWMPGWSAWKPWSEVPEIAALVPPAPPPLP